MKRKTILTLLFGMLLLIGCTKNTNNAMKLKDLDIKKNVSLVAYFNKKLLYTEDIDNKNDTVNFTYSTLDTSNSKTDTIGQVKNLNIDSGDVQVLNDNDIYIYPGVYKNNTLTSNFIKFDINNKATTNISSSKDVNPLIYFNELNNKEILINGAISKSNGTAFKYYVDKYDTSNNTRKNIISSDFNVENSTGKLIVSVSVDNNKIYAYSIENNKDNIKYFIDIYDGNGKLEKSITLDDFEKYLKDSNGDLDTVFKFKSLNNHFYFHTLSDKSILLKYDGNQLKEIPLGEPNTLSLELIDTSSKNLNDSSSSIIYFLDRSEYKLYSLDLNNPKLIPLKLEIDETYKYITQGVVDKSGNLIIKAIKDIYAENKDNSFKYYLVSKD